MTKTEGFFFHTDLTPTWNDSSLQNVKFIYLDITVGLFGHKRHVYGEEIVRMTGYAELHRSWKATTQSKLPPISSPGKKTQQIFATCFRSVQFKKNDPSYFYARCFRFLASRKHRLIRVFQTLKCGESHLFCWQHQWRAGSTRGCSCARRGGILPRTRAPLGLQHPTCQHNTLPVTP